MKPAVFRCIDDETLLPDGREVWVIPDRCRDRRLVRLAVGAFDLPQYNTLVFLDPATAENLGACLIREGQRGQLLEAGWTPTPDDAEGVDDTDEWWTPPDDKRAVWRFAAAVARLR